MTKYDKVVAGLKHSPKTWLITGVAGFIGSNLLETLLKMDQAVVGVDNMATGYHHNLLDVEKQVSPEQWKNFTFILGDICDYPMCQAALKGVDYVLHQAALGSVPRSIVDPLATNKANVDGFLKILHAAKEENVTSFTFAASSSTYGDHPALPKKEENIGSPLSPYAVTKLVNELYASVYAKTYGFNTIGLRYFNVFGKRQDPNGAYAAVIPKWVGSIIKKQNILINGDGETSRDFCYIENTIQMNILAATAPLEAKNQIYNVAVGERTTLNELYTAIKTNLGRFGIYYDENPIYQDFRVGDVRHSQADIGKAVTSLGYRPQFSVFDGLKQAMPWYTEFMK